MNRRAVLKSLASAAGAVLPGAALAACETPQSRPKEAGPQTLTFLDWNSTLEGLPTETVLKNFQAKAAAQNITFTFDTLGQNYEEKMRTLLAAGTPYDVHRINDDYVRGHGAKGLLTDLLPYIRRDRIKREDFWEFIYDFASHEGKYWAWSTGNQPRVLYVNKTLFQNKAVQAPLFDQWDPPGWTWEDMVTAAQRLTDTSNPDRPTYGVNFYEDTGYEQTILVNFGVDDGIYSKDGKRWTMASPKGIDAVQAAIDLHCRLRVQRPFNHNEGGTRVGGAALFSQGRLGMHYGTMTAMTAFRRDIRDFDWDIAPVPKKEKRVTEGSLICYCVPKDARNPDGAWQLLQHMTGEESGRTFAERQFYIPSSKAATKHLQARAGEKPERINLFVESMRFNSLPNWTNNTERARQIYRPELNTKAYICGESAKTTIEGVKKQVEDSLVGLY